MVWHNWQYRILGAIVKSDLRAGVESDIREPLIRRVEQARRDYTARNTRHAWCSNDLSERLLSGIRLVFGGNVKRLSMLEIKRSNVR